MTTKLDTLLDTLEKLDAARTGGDWYKSGANRIATTAGHRDFPGSSWQVADTICDPENDTPFIVAAVNSNAKLREIIRVQRKVLEDIISQHTGDDWEDSPHILWARQAISQVEKILESL